MKHFNKTILFFCLALLFSCGKEYKVKNHLKNVVATNKQINNISYELIKKETSIGKEDTTIRSAIVWVKTLAEDTLYGYKIRVKETSDPYEHIYSSDQNYFIMHNRKKVMQKQPKYMRGGYPSYTYHTSVINEMFEGIYTQPRPPQSVSWKDKTKEHFIITLHYPDNDKFENVTEDLWINRKTFVIERSQLIGHSKAGSQSTEIQLSNIKINQPDFDDKIFSIDEFADYELKSNLPPTRKKRPKLPEVNTLCPDFELYDTEGKQHHLSDHKGKLVLLDFWSLSCAPCRLVVPYFNEFNNKYKDKGLLVLSMNLDDIDRKEKIVEYAHKKIEFPTILAAETGRELYGVSGVPSLMLIDKDFKFKFVYSGYKRALMDSIEQLIITELE